MEALKRAYKDTLEQLRLVPAMRQMRGFFYRFVLHCVMYTVGVESTKPSEKEYERLKGYYDSPTQKATLQGSFDALIIEGMWKLVDHRGGGNDISEKDSGFNPEVVKAFDARNIRSIQDLFDRDYRDFTERQGELLLEDLKRMLVDEIEEPDEDSEGDEDESTNESDNS